MSRGPTPRRPSGPAGRTPRGRAGSAPGGWDPPTGGGRRGSLLDSACGFALPPAAARTAVALAQLWAVNWHIRGAK